MQTQITQQTQYYQMSCNTVSDLQNDFHAKLQQIQTVPSR